MSYIDPDLLHGVLENVITAVNDNSETLTANGVTPATITASLTAIKGDLGAKKSTRDKQRTTLKTSQDAFEASAAANYTSFSDLIDTIAGGLGKKTPAGKQILGYRQHVTGSDRRSSQPPAPAPTTATKTSQ